LLTRFATARRGTARGTRGIRPILLTLINEEALSERCETRRHPEGIPALALALQVQAGGDRRGRSSTDSRTHVPREQHDPNGFVALSRISMQDLLRQITDGWNFQVLKIPKNEISC